MSTLRNLTIFLFLTAFVTCTIPKQNITAKRFLVSVKSIKGDTIINSAVYHSGHIFCLQEDGKVIVLDTAFNFVDSLTARFSKLKIQFLHSYNDTILLSTDKDIFYLDTGFALKKYNNQPFKYGLPYYNDSTYYVHACSAGEWGGAVFFWNKKTNKTFSYPATGVQQVFKFKDNYVVSSFLAHMSGFSDYLLIKDPTKLYELKDEKQKRFCNWYVDVDSLKGKKHFDTTLPSGVKYYADEFTTRTMLAFPYNDTLYSIYCTDSATILAKHVNFKIIPIDTLLKRRISFQFANTHLTNDVSVTAYRENWGTSDANKNPISYQNTGLIFRHGNRITFLEFKTPHMWTKD
ncbi:MULTISPECIES: hypothetical protein [Niastella]|uniref:Uncharacterized protein n=1 Tax=Niastella soli TaxID=2821487 RepID=A0ABS3YZQ2_9BACT|nr:hypothetical protein [Niastella soli]MBO9203233.1 hypothetical protein [Niastella soli]